MVVRLTCSKNRELEISFIAKNKLRCSINVLDSRHHISPSLFFIPPLETPSCAAPARPTKKGAVLDKLSKQVVKSLNRISDF
jgi:hypothetical protein